MKNHCTCMIFTGWLILSISASADIVWSGEQNLTGDYQYVDFNFDSQIDVTLEYSVSGDLSVESGRIGAYVDGLGGIDGPNRILVDSSSGYDAALPFGTLIFANSNSSLGWAGGDFFSGTVSSWVVYDPDFPGPSLESDEEWQGLLGTNGNTYVGIEFDIAGATHYGWINIALGPEEGPEGFKMPITTSWAYESTPGAGIAAGAIPEPSTGVLALVGAAALLLARRRGIARSALERGDNVTSFHSPNNHPVLEDESNEIRSFQ